MTLTSPSSTRRRGSRLWSIVETLAAPHAVDRYLELVDPMLTADELRAEITDVERQTHDTVTMTLRPTRQWEGFRAGQFVQVGVVVDGVRHTRCYSPACSQLRGDGHIELTVKAQKDGVVSQYLFEHATPGLVVNLSQASGTFSLPSPRPANILLVSGGSGVTPVMSMLRTLADEGYTGNVAFLHYAYTDRDVPYRDALSAFDNVHIAYTDEERPGHLHGFFSTEHLEAVAPWYRDAETYLCGPPGLMKGVAAVFDELGASHALHTEDFAPAAAPADGDATGTVSFGGVSADNTGATLLEQAEAAGLTPEFGCRMGICFTCTSVKKSGCTRNVKSGEVDSDPDSEIQLCVSVPVGDVTIDL